MTEATYTPKELARRWRCKLDAIYAHIHAGRLDAFNIAPGNKRATWRILAAEVKRFETSGRNVAPQRRRKPKASRPAGWVNFY